MKNIVIFIFVILICLIYVMDLIICLLYSKMKKKKDARSRIAKQNQKADTQSDIEKTQIQIQSGIVWGIKQLMNGWIMYRLKRLGHVPCQWYRSFILKHIFQMNIAPKVVIYSWNYIRAPWNISIGEGTIIGYGTSLDGRNFLTIGKNVNISSDVNIYTEQHDINDPYFRSLESGGEVIIEDRAWISSHTIILPKVHIGEGAVLASGALASKNIDAFCVMGGVPAKKIGERSRDLRYEFDGKSLPFI